MTLAGDSEPVLLCFERPPINADNWCHRRMVTEPFGETLSLEVPELELEPMQDLFGSIDTGWHFVKVAGALCPRPDDRL